MPAVDWNEFEAVTDEPKAKAAPPKVDWSEYEAEPTGPVDRWGKPLPPGVVPIDWDQVKGEDLKPKSNVQLGRVNWPKHPALGAAVNTGAQAVEGIAQPENLLFANPVTGPALAGYYGLKSVAELSKAAGELPYTWKTLNAQQRYETLGGLLLASLGTLAMSYPAARIKELALKRYGVEITPEEALESQKWADKEARRRATPSAAGPEVQIPLRPPPPIPGMVKVPGAQVPALGQQLGYQQRLQNALGNPLETAVPPGGVSPVDEYLGGAKWQGKPTGYGGPLEVVEPRKAPVEPGEGKLTPQLRSADEIRQEREAQAAQWRAAEKGERNASGKQETGKVYEDVPVQPREGQGEVPVKEGGEGVQPHETQEVEAPPKTSFRDAAEKAKFEEWAKARKAGGEGGFVWAPELKNWPEGLLKAWDWSNKVRRGIAWRFRNGETLMAMSYKKDAGNTAAALFAQQAGEGVNGMLRRAVGKPTLPTGQESLTHWAKPWSQPDAVPRAALTFVREAGMDANELSRMRGQVAGAPDPANMTKPRLALWQKKKEQALAAIDYGLTHLNELRPVAERYGEITKAQAAEEVQYGMKTPYHNNYVMHLQDIDKESFGALRGGGYDANFRMQRTHRTYADSIAKGVIPESLDAVALLKARLHTGQNGIQKRVWMEELRGMHDAQGNALTAPLTRVASQRPLPNGQLEDFLETKAPEGYEKVSLGGQELAVRRGFDTYFHLLNDPSKVSDFHLGPIPVGQAALNLATTGKHILLGLDTFHLGRLAAWSTLVKGNPGYRKGLMLLDHSEADLLGMARRGEIPQRYVQDLFENKRRMGLMQKTGYNVSGVTDNLYSGIVEHVPITGAFNQWLFGQYQRGAMVESWLHEFDRQRGAYPNLSETEVARKVSGELNTRYGNLHNQSFFKSKTFTDLVRLFFLAPGWNEGLIRSEAGTVKQAGQMVRDLATQRRIASGALLKTSGRLFVGQLVANQIINLLTRGHPTTENPEEGFIAKLSAYVPDSLGGPGLFISPLELPFETASKIVQGVERKGYLGSAVRQYLQSREGALSRPIMTWLTKRDVFDRPIPEGEVTKAALDQAIPRPISLGAFYSMGREAAGRAMGGQEAAGSLQEFPGQYQKQAMASVGIKTHNVPSPVQRISQLAEDYRRAHGLEKKGEYYAADYDKLFAALRVNNQKNALTAMRELVGKKDLKTLVTHFTRGWANPFTHAKRTDEFAFYDALTPEQRRTYDAAVNDKRMQSQKALELLDKVLAAK